MKKIISLTLFLSILTVAFSQTSNNWSAPGLTSQPGDHFMIQVSSDNWANMPDSVSRHKSGFSRGFNFALMINKPFKTNPKYSVAFGIGISTSNIFFSTVNIDVASTSTGIPFTNDSSTNHFEKYKLATSFVEIPIELRYTFHPERQNKSWKIAIGTKVGFMLDAHTKGKTLVDQYGNLVDPYTEKQSSTNFFNTTRLCGTARVGYGSFSLFTAWQLTSFFKNGAGPGVIPYQIGLCLSGL
jgi:hypothetical protein